MKTDQETLLSAVASVIKDVKKDLDSKLEKLSPEALMESAEMEKHQQLEATVLRYLHGFSNEKSVVVKGEASPVLTRALR